MDDAAGVLVARPQARRRPVERIEAEERAVHRKREVDDVAQLDLRHERELLAVPGRPVEHGRHGRRATEPRAAGIASRQTRARPGEGDGLVRPCLAAELAAQAAEVSGRGESLSRLGGDGQRRRLRVARQAEAPWLFARLAGRVTKLAELPRGALRAPEQLPEEGSSVVTAGHRPSNASDRYERTTRPSRPSQHMPVAGSRGLAAAERDGAVDDTYPSRSRACSARTSSLLAKREWVEHGEIRVRAGPEHSAAR